MLNCTSLSILRKSVSSVYLGWHNV
uniref:Uncharacterized protein n=1 Tax=Arundo donax TaxID=35708 RepID=A0A0A9HJH7_ARUDO